LFGNCFHIFNYLFNLTYHSVSISKRINVCQANKFTKTIMSAKLVIKICVFFINFTNRQFWAARPALRGTKFGGGEKRSGESEGGQAE